MDAQLSKKLQNLLIGIFQNRDNFYKRKYLKAGIEKKKIKSFNWDVFQKLPLTSEKELSSIPYKLRCLKEEQGLNKLVFLKNVNKFLLVHKTLQEIKKDSLPLEGLRPMVITDDSYESLEYCLFFYQQGILPLIGEVINPGILYSMAAQYRIDSLVLDLASKKLFQGELLKLKLPLKSVTLIDSFFSPQELAWPGKINIHYLIALPEFGRIAYLCQESFKKGSFVFHPFEDVLIEAGQKAILTNVNLAACPMIRYQSDLHLEAVVTSCSCRQPSFKLY